MDRLAILQQFYEEDPEDPFNLYGLALEWNKHDKSRAAELLGLLLKQHPAYLPAYYQLASLLINLGSPEPAIEIIRRGINVAMQQNEGKAAAELRSLLETLDAEHEG